MICLSLQTYMWMITEALFVTIKHWKWLGGPSAGRRVTDYGVIIQWSSAGREKGAHHGTSKCGWVSVYCAEWRGLMWSVLPVGVLCPWTQVPAVRYHCPWGASASTDTVSAGIQGGFPGGSVVKDPPANVGDAGDVVQSLGLENPLEEEMATHSSIPAGNPMDRVAWRASDPGVADSWTRPNTDT